MEVVSWLVCWLGNYLIKLKYKNETVLETMENNILKWYGHVLSVEDNMAYANNDLVAGRKRKTPNEVGKGNGKNDEAEEFNT
jgi:hypothetical protein